MEQRERMSVLAAFIEGQFPVLVATGIAGRGLDLVDVTQVVNFDPPATIDGESMLGSGDALLCMHCADASCVMPQSTSIAPDVQAGEGAEASVLRTSVLQSGCTARCLMRACKVACVSVCTHVCVRTCA